jgi:hypothetical protein
MASDGTIPRCSMSTWNTRGADWPVEAERSKAIDSMLSERKRLAEHREKNKNVRQKNTYETRTDEVRTDGATVPSTLLFS